MKAWLDLEIFQVRINLSFLGSIFEREFAEGSQPDSQRALNMRLQRLSDRIRYDIERPMSPFPKKDKLINYVNSLASIYIQDREDIQLLQTLITKEDEFVMAAFGKYNPFNL